MRRNTRQKKGAARSAMADRDSDWASRTRAGPSAGSTIDLPTAAADALRSNVQVPGERIAVRVDDGWLILEGDADSEGQREAAVSCVGHLTGVRGATNLITLKPRPLALDVSRRIQDALKCSAEADSKRIAVETADGTVTLM